MALQFTANRFKKSLSPSVEDGNRDSQSKARKLSDLKGKSSSTTTVLSCDSYSLSKLSTYIPMLEENESLVDLSAVEPGIVICTTTKRTFVYKIGNHSSYPLEFNHEDCSRPLVNVIPNHTAVSKPNMVLIDPFKGTLRFIENLNLTPSLTVVQNEQSVIIPLYSNEIICSSQYEDNLGLLISTSQRRVLLVTFIDSLGNVNISTSVVYHNRSIFNFMLSKDFSSSKSIKSICILNKSPVIKNILILENDNNLIIINHILSSGVFSLECKVDLNRLLSNLKMESLLDFLLINNNANSIQLLVLSKQTDQFLAIFKIDLSNLNYPQVVSSIKIPNSAYANGVKFILFNDKNVGLIKFQVKSITKLYIFNMNASSNSNTMLLENMNQSIVFTNDIINVGYNSSENNNCIRLCTRNAILLFNYYAFPKPSNIIDDIEFKIQQYLLFNTDDSPISYNVIDTNVNFTPEDAETSIKQIMSKILQNNLSNSKLNSIEIPIENLLRRIKIFKHVVIYISDNFSITNAMVETILSSSSFLSLSYSFLNSIHNEDLQDQVLPLIKSSKAESVGSYIINNSIEIIELISSFIDNNLPLKNEHQIVNLASFLNTIFNNGYLESDLSIKHLLNIKKINFSSFSSHNNLLQKINHILEKLFNVAVETDKIYDVDSISENITDSLYGLSLFLYYSTKETLISNLNKVEFSDFLKINKLNWINIFCVCKKQSEVIPFADQFEDLECLAILIDTQREEVNSIEENEKLISEAKGYILYETSNELLQKQNDVKQLFDYYFDKYGYSFSSSLFEYYVKTNKMSHLLTNFNEKKYCGYLNRFLDENRSNGYYKFTWIKDIKQEKFKVVAKELLTQVQEFDDSIKNKQVLLSISKLSAVVGNDSANLGAPLIREANIKLSLLKLQDSIQTKFEDLSFRKNARDETITSLPISQQDSLFHDQILNVISLLQAKKEVSLIPLINVSTLLILQKDFVTENIFDDIVKCLISIIKLQLDASLSHIANKILWRRIVLWDKKEILSNKSDISAIKFIQYMALYKGQLIIPKLMDDFIFSEGELYEIGESSKTINGFMTENEEIKSILVDWAPFKSLNNF